MQAYFRAMDALHRACVFFAGVAIVIISIIIPYGVFTRYVLNSASSWPEPMAILLMIVLSFLSAVVCYREHLHIGVGMLPNALKGVPRTLLGIFLEFCMLATNLFMLWYGVRLVHANLVPKHRRVSDRVRRRVVSAGADCRIHHHPLHHRTLPQGGLVSAAAGSGRCGQHHLVGIS